MPQDEKVIFPNFAEIWKESYFKTESAWADAFKEYVRSETFGLLLNKALDQQLSMGKITQENVDKYFESSPLPSKKDIARIAELVIAVEDKVDNLDSQFAANLQSMAESLLRMSMVLGETKQEITVLQQEIAQLNKKVEALSKKSEPKKKETQVRQKKAVAKETEG